MKARIEILSDDLGKDWRAQWIDGTLLGGTYGAPERALESLLAAMNQAALEDTVQAMQNAGAASGCYAGSDISEAAHPAAAIGAWDDEIWDYSEAARG